MRKAEIIRLLLTMVPQQRGRILREGTPDYFVDAGEAAAELSPSFDALLNNISFTDL